jgi:hypothetical protein
MGGQHGRSAVHHLGQKIRTAGVEACVRLVEDEQTGLVQHGPGDREALLLAARKAAGRSPRHVGEPD